MGSKPWFCRHCKKFLTSAIIKWWFSTSKVPTWRENSTTTKWRFVFIIRLLEGNTSALQNDDWKGYVFHCWLRLGFHMLPSEGQLPLLQNEIGFLYVVFRWANSLATKWLSIFKGLSTTETLKTYKMQFPSCGYKMPGPSPFFHLNLSPEMPLKRGTRPPIL